MVVLVCVHCFDERERLCRRIVKRVESVVDARCIQLTMKSTRHPFQKSFEALCLKTFFIRNIIMKYIQTAPSYPQLILTLHCPQQ